MSPHQRLADQGRMGARRDDPPNVLGCSNPAFADDGAVAGYFWGQSFSHIQIELERGKVAVVDADKGCSNGKRSVEFSFVMNFDKAINPDLIGYRLKPNQFIIGERGNNQKHSIGTGERGLIDLDFVEGEVLSENRPWNSVPDQCEVIEMTLKEFLVSQD
jgi:hypothetical protein